MLWYERLHPEDKARWNVEFSRFLIQDEPFRSVYRFLARDGHVVWVRGEVKMIRNEHGEPICVQEIGFDITELKQADEARNGRTMRSEERVKERTAQLSEQRTRRCKRKLPNANGARRNCIAPSYSCFIRVSWLH